MPSAVLHRMDGAVQASITGVHTQLLTLSPAFLDAVRGLAPRKRRSRVPYIVLFAVLAVLAVLVADTSTREFVAALVRGH